MAQPGTSLAMLVNNEMNEILEKKLQLKRTYYLIGPRLQTDGTYRFTLVRPTVCPSVHPSVTDFLGNCLMKFSEIWYVDAF